MSKKKLGILICLCVALFGVATMTGCGAQNTEPTEPKIKTTIDPKNWARVEDYADYGVEEETTPVEETTAPVEETEPVVKETEPAPTEPAPTEPPAVVLYNVAKDNNKRYFLASDLGELNIAGEKVNLLTLNVSDL